MEELTTNVAGQQRQLLLVLGLTLGYLLIEIIAGVLTHSLSLVADAVHMFTDAGALALAAFAAWMSQKPPSPERTYGYQRTEILAALVNGLLLLGSTLFILYEAYQRWQTPGEVIGWPMLIVAAIGLGVNLLGIWLLHGSSGDNLNMQGALYEVAKDALGSVAVIVAGIVILTTGWVYADPLASALIALLILPRTWQLLRDAVDVLLEATPAHIDARAVQQALYNFAEIEAVHDLHIWTITSGFEALSVHVVLKEDLSQPQAQRLLEQINARLRQDFQIEHTTIQVERRTLEAEESAF